MSEDQINDQITREDILNLLSDAETARVATAEGQTALAPGDDYIDLENLSAGVRQAGQDGKVHASTVLPRKAVSAATWSRIVAILPA